MLSPQGWMAVVPSVELLEERLPDSSALACRRAGFLPVLFSNVKVVLTPSQRHW